MNLPPHTRRYDLDWLRVVAFSLLIFYHIGMFYVTWGWHVKSQYVSTTIEPLMLTLNPWRLALLFFISGVAIRFATDKIDTRMAFAKSRLTRLGIPILGGIFLIVVPQAYFELRQAGVIEAGFLCFYPSYLIGGPNFPIITPTWNHLWYVVYLLVYILIILAILPCLKTMANGRIRRFFNWVFSSVLRLFLLVPVPFIVMTFSLSQWFPTTHDLVNDWGNHGQRFTIFMLGYFVAKHDVFWQGIERAFPTTLVAFILLWPLWVFNPVPELIQPIAGEFYAVVEVLYAWVCIVFLLGLAQRYANSDSRLLRYLTQAVFCYYILHQTLIIVIGSWLTPLSLGASFEFFIVLFGTLIGCGLGYEGLKRIPLLRAVFGIVK